MEPQANDGGEVIDLRRGDRPAINQSIRLIASLPSLLSHLISLTISHQAVNYSSPSNLHFFNFCFFSHLYRNRTPPDRKGLHRHLMKFRGCRGGHRTFPSESPAGLCAGNHLSRASDWPQGGVSSNPDPLIGWMSPRRAHGNLVSQATMKNRSPLPGCRGGLSQRGECDY